MSISEEYIANIVSILATKCGFSRWQYSLEKFDNVGQNYFGIIVPVILSGVNAKGDVTMSFVLKLAPTDERYRVSGAVTFMFHREIFVYSVLLEKYREFTSPKPPLVLPTLYHVDKEYCKEVIVMQNMCELGYKPFSESVLDLDHIKVALKSLAQFHAMSFLLKESSIKLYNEVIEICVPLREETAPRYMTIMKDRLLKALDKFANSPYESLFEKLKINCGKIFENAIEKVLGTCICHGDIWKENILFQYDQNNKPVSACLIDYQTTRLSSPAFDTLYLIISSTDTKLRKTDYYNILDVYYAMFSLTLQEGSLNPKELYSKESFLHDLKVVAPACLITANTALWLSNGLQEEGHVRSKHIWNTPKEKQMAADKYKHLVKSIIDDFYSYGYLPGQIL